MRIAAVLFFVLLALTAAPAVAQDGTLRVAVASMLSPKETFVEYRRLVEYLGRKTGRKATLVQRKDYAQTDRLLKDSAVDLAFVCVGPYVRDHDEFGVELIAAPVVGGKTHYKSYIIVRTDAPYKDLMELEGKGFAYTDPKSNTGCEAPMYMLAMKGRDPESFFGRVIYTKGHDNSVEAVSKGVVQGAAVDSLVYGYMWAKGYKSALNTKVIDESMPFAMPPVVMPKGVPPALKEEVRKALLNMHLDPEGKKILDGLLIDKFVVPSDKDYDPVRKMAGYMNKRGRKKKNHEPPQPGH